ncbi:hypothetical protein [Clostridium perfringens]|uniref:hypothetical protein n=1 Tax=Clostridium perfringens TaxID=1502 RepID=UPI003A0FC64A
MNLKNFKNIKKSDIIFAFIYFLAVAIYMLLDKLYFNFSSGINLIVILTFLVVASLYRELSKKKINPNIKQNLKRLTIFAMILSLLSVGTLTIPSSKKVYAYPYNSTSNVKRIPVSVHFTASQCREIANRGASIGEWTTWTSFIAGFGKGTAFLGALTALYGYGVSKNLSVFLTAANRGTGLTISYTYVIPPYTNIGSFENTRISYY